MINAELAARHTNTKTKDVLRDHIPKEHQPGLRIDFACECADSSCAERVPLTLLEYEKLHNDPARFVICKGHEVAKIEKVHKETINSLVVEKYAL